MKVEERIKEYITTQSEPKRGEMQALHLRILRVLPKCKLWFLDGKDDKGKIVTNPNIGYGTQTINYANGASKEFYQIGISANTSRQASSALLNLTQAIRSSQVRRAFGCDPCTKPNPILEHRIMNGLHARRVARARRSRASVHQRMEGPRSGLQRAVRSSRQGSAHPEYVGPHSVLLICSME